MTKTLIPLEAEVTILKTRLNALEETQAFIDMYYILRVAEKRPLRGQRGRA